MRLAVWSWYWFQLLQLPLKLSRASGGASASAEVAELRFVLFLEKAPSSWASQSTWEPGSVAADAVRATVAEYFEVATATVQVGLAKGRSFDEKLGGIELQTTFHCSGDQLLTVLSRADAAFRDPKEFQTMLRAYSIFWGTTTSDVEAMRAELGAIQVFDAIPATEKSEPRTAPEVYKYAWYAGPWGSCDRVCGGVQMRQLFCEMKGHSMSGSVEARVDTRLCLRLVRPTSWQECDAPSCRTVDHEKAAERTGFHGPTSVSTYERFHDAHFEFFLITPLDGQLRRGGLPWVDIIFACVGPNGGTAPCAGYTMGHLESGPRCSAKGRSGEHPLLQVDGSQASLMALRGDRIAQETVAEVAKVSFATAFMLLVDIPAEPGTYWLCLGFKDTMLQLTVPGPVPAALPAPAEAVAAPEGMPAPAPPGEASVAAPPTASTIAPPKVAPATAQHYEAEQRPATQQDATNDDWTEEELTYLLKVLGIGATCGATVTTCLILMFCHRSQKGAPIGDHGLGPSKYGNLASPAPVTLGRSKSSPATAHHHEGSAPQWTLPSGRRHSFPAASDSSGRQKCPDVPTVRRNSLPAACDSSDRRKCPEMEFAHRHSSPANSAAPPLARQLFPDDMAQGAPLVQGIAAGAVRWEIHSETTRRWRSFDASLAQQAEHLHSKWIWGQSGAVHEVCTKNGARSLDFRAMMITELSTGSIRAIRRLVVADRELLLNRAGLSWQMA